ncbi:hypothetical protein SAY86_013226 [Trapa natans]|uniref:PWWP domain-containing protein n=1 Tax=Trapa natans TaxID=22666 RepID=A0AAN7MBD8_TRANT|nr:hypothetical protein SAY86_013226 [Trapa natans]
MRNKNQASGKRTSKNSGDEGPSSQAKGEPSLGSLIWIKFSGNSWWPAQAVDENNISESKKPDGKLAGDILVRLYGSYQYYYVNPIKCHSAFKTALQQNNGNYQDIFRKSLEQDVPTSKYSRSKGGGSKSKGNSSKSASKDTMSNRRLFKANQELEETTVRQAAVTTTERKTKNKGRTPKKDEQAGTSSELGAMGTPEFEIGSISERLKSCSRSAAEKAKARISRQVQAKSDKHDGLLKEHFPRKSQISEENNSNGNVGGDNQKKKISSRKERLRDELGEQDRTLGSDSKKQKISSDKKEGKSEVPKVEEIVKKEKPAPTQVGKPEKLSMRRVRVMKTLGLIGPTGSPFCKNSHIIALD